MPGEYLLGIDVGTSACKIALFDREGRCIIQMAGEYPVYYPKIGWAEQDPSDWWDAICRTVKACLEKSGVKPQQIAGIGVDGQSWSAIAVDGEGKVLTRNPIWMDTRSEEICRRTAKQIGEDVILEVCGNSMTGQYSTGKVLWYKENLPQVYEKIDKILQSNSYIVYKLTGEMTQELSQGYGFHCFNMRKGTWDLEMCRALGIPESFLPSIYACDAVVGTVTKEAAKACGLIEGIPVVAGGLDAACGTLGTGVLYDGETQEQGGQAGGMSICTETYKADPRLILSFHVVPDRWLLQGGTTGGGGVMRWFEQNFADYERSLAEQMGMSSLEQLNVIAKEVEPGCGGLTFLPYMSGERTPIWDANAKGVFYGIDFSKTKGHFVRAAMEGVAYSLRHNLEAAKDAGAEAKVLRSMGGSANSLLWTQIKPDVTGLPIVVPNSDLATTYGAAMLAGKGVGFFEDYDTVVKNTIHIKREHQPNTEVKPAYDRAYELYRQIYEDLKETMHRF